MCMGGSQSTWTDPTQAQGQHENSTQTARSEASVLKVESVPAVIEHNLFLAC